MPAARVPFLAGRIDGASRNAKDRLPNGFMHELKKFYYDLAGAANAGAVASLLQLVTTGAGAVRHRFSARRREPGRRQGACRSSGLFSESDLRAIDRDNAVRLLPRLGIVAQCQLQTVTYRCGPSGPPTVEADQVRTA